MKYNGFCFICLQLFAIFKESDLCEILPKFVNQHLEVTNPFFKDLKSILFLDESQYLWSSEEILQLFNNDIAIINLNYMTQNQKEKWFENNLNIVEDSWIIVKEAQLIDFAKFGTWLIETIANSDLKQLRLDSRVFKYNCNETSDILTIGEIYSIKNEHIVEHEKILEYNNTDNQMQYFESSFMWQRRQDLKGITLVNTNLEWDSYFFIQIINGEKISTVYYENFDFIE